VARSAAAKYARETGFAFFIAAVGNRRFPPTQTLCRLPPKNPISPLLYADTDRSADALFFGRVSVPDPFIAFGARGKKYAVVSALEFGRVRRTSDFDVVLPLERFLARARKLWPQRKPRAADVIQLVARQVGVRRFVVPPDFPAEVYRRLVELGLRIDVAPEALFPEREIKSPREAAAIREGNRCSAVGIAAAERMLRRSRVRGRKLIFEGAELTSERLRTAVEIACLEAGAVSLNTIVAGGDQACDPHERGSGPLRANELIIVDVFPRVTKTGYFGDMTRTFLRGRASDRQRALVAAVRAAQLAALDAIRAGANGREIHGKVTALFAACGFETKHTPRGSLGFFHGTGHGLGLEIHEPPRISGSVDYALKKGSVVTVEPGLYYPGLGGCRIEDVVQVAARAPKMLSSYHYDWELR
jgi:Xaa-Pro aminopeptidase